jgi:hypothetical protein
LDTEFINLFISKQRALIDDLQSRLLLSETKLALVESKLEQANKTLESFKIDKKAGTAVKKAD